MLRPGYRGLAANRRRTGYRAAGGEAPGGSGGPLAFLECPPVLGLPRTSIELISGPTNRSKAFRLTGITTAEAEARLLNQFA